LVSAICAVATVTAAFAQIVPADDAPKPLTPESSAEQFQTPDGYEVQLVVAEPLIREPSGVCWDSKGRCYICELHGYNMEGQFDIDELNKTGKLDRIVRRIDASESAKKAAEAETYGTVKQLSDTDCDGRMDHATLFAERLPACHGVCPARDGIIVVCAPDIVYLADRDGDGRAEVREVLYTGFPAVGLERRINCPQWGLDDWIYVGRGVGDATITGPHLKHAVKLPNTDFRIKADGTAIEPVLGCTYTFGSTFTERGDRFVVTTTTPGIFVAPLPWKYLARNPDYAAHDLEQFVGDTKTYPISKPHPWRVKRAEDPGFEKYYHDRYGIAEAAPDGYFTSVCSPFVY